MFCHDDCLKHDVPHRECHHSILQWNIPRSTLDWSCSPAHGDGLLCITRPASLSGVVGSLCLWRPKPRSITYWSSSSSNVAAAAAAALPTEAPAGNLSAARRVCYSYVCIVAHPTAGELHIAAGPRICCKL
jgi:hypothetical protein